MTGHLEFWVGVASIIGSMLFKAGQLTARVADIERRLTRIEGYFSGAIPKYTWPKKR